MDISCNNNISFGQHLVTHRSITELAAKLNGTLSRSDQRVLGRCSQMPDVDKREVVDFISPHFYDVLHEDPSFGTVNDARNNAFSRFMTFTRRALKQKDMEGFLRNIGYAIHYLQDAATPPHIEHGNYLQKLFRLPMHIQFEKGKKLGASSKLDILIDNYKFEDMSPSSNISTKKEDIPKIVEMLFHNTALFSAQPWNQVKYRNFMKWPEIQQRSFDKGVNATRAYLDLILPYAPKSETDKPNIKQYNRHHIYHPNIAELKV